MRVAVTGIKLTSSPQKELSIGNTVRRVLRVIREEASDAEEEVAHETSMDDINRTNSLLSTHTSMYNLLAATNKKASETLARAHSDLKGAVIEALNQMLDELENVYSSITLQALEHIHSKYVFVNTWARWYSNFATAKSSSPWASRAL